MSSIFTHPIPAIIILLGVLVFVHELGHYLVGRWCGVAVETFSIGFGPRMFGWRSGDTDYRVSWMPLGGFVKFYGSTKHESVPAHLRGKEFATATVGRRALIAAAGPLANFALAVVVYTILGKSGIPHPPAKIGDVMPQSAADRAGIMPGDTFTEIRTAHRIVKIDSWSDLESVISTNPSVPLQVTLKRHSETQHVTLTPDLVTMQDMFGRDRPRGRAGVMRGNIAPFLAVTDRASVASRAGLKTGDRVKELIITLGDQARRVLVDSYAEFVVVLAEVAAADNAQVSIALDDGRTVVINPTDWNRVLTQVHSQAVANSGPATVGRNIAKILGITDAQLVLEGWEDGASGPLKKGDRLVSFAGTPTGDLFSLSERLMANKEPKVLLGVMRGFDLVIVPVELLPIEAQKPEGKVTIYTLPVKFLAQPEEPQPVIEQYSNIFSALWFGLKETGRQTAVLVGTLGNLIRGEVPIKALGGPVMIAKVASDSAKMGWQAFLTSLALISVNLGLINLFPIPILDGGQLVLFGVEFVRRKPVSDATFENFQRLGFVMIMSLVLLATYNDISRFWKSMLTGLNLF